jgi:hypothetical protein
MHALRIDLDQRLGQEVGLFLVVALQTDAVAWLKSRFEERSHGFGRDEFANKPRPQLVPGPCQPVGAIDCLGIPVHAVHLIAP